MSTVVAGEIKKRGVSALAAALEEDDEAVITVRGESRYVVMKLIIASPGGFVKRGGRDPTLAIFCRNHSIVGTSSSKAW